ncbi:MAG: hypothetical protein FWE67_16520 [Planctomycetaceae bacterium]|nr:hypothetical protein [Planctomycetaceae bacterium]
MLKTAEERTGWRDEGISRRRRMWGWDCPAVDIDFLALEYDTGKPVALIEYKNEHAQPIRLGHPSARALKTLADSAGLPLFFVRCTDDFSRYYLTPANEKAKQLFAAPDWLSEKKWIEFLYRCRGREVPDELSEQLV